MNNGPVVMLIGVILLCAVVVIDANSDDKVKYCKNGQTGEIVVVQKGMPCPRGTHEI